ncbi:unnamed protein product [Rotaria socialis]|uniref:Uncharacterized protein n=1 Tax=Rotaria socialis TaxID=392032 RepID=A0A817SWZ4_9BILA|nr:unnamed protein product [Rotaria socialis]
MMDVPNRGQKYIKKIKVNTDERTSQISSNVDSNKQLTVSPSSENELNQPYSTTETLISTNRKKTGPGHCKKFEVRLTVANKTSIGMETSIKRAQQTAEQALATTTLKKPEKSRHKSKSSRTSRIKKVPSNDPQKNLPQQQVPVEINQQQINPIHENTFEILLNKKHDEISEQKSIINTLHDCVRDIERALKFVSDRIMKQFQLKKYTLHTKIITPFFIE